MANDDRVAVVDGTQRRLWAFCSGQAATHDGRRRFSLRRTLDRPRWAPLMMDMLIYDDGGTVMTRDRGTGIQRNIKCDLGWLRRRAERTAAATPWGSDRCWTSATKQRRHQKPRSSHRSVEFIGVYFEFM
ncbi:uncharacterized protein LOC118479819 [Helianthus annuus]|uniref:uncharacterized protein LOC118479819 n=1 Tax=Helianthus annuus TaxID=4232 RepID=UPI001652C79B|nr:uncharacterized protein LOC118479819 [Helianthus annuus]